MNTQPIWTILNSEDANYLAAISNFLLCEFSRIFGTDCMTAEPCVIYNDPDASCPMLIINSNPIRIRLAQSSLVYWAQTIFQLSHELCHYVMRQHKVDKTFTLSWYEEIVCEAFSLYALKFASDNWNQCSLSKSAPNFNQSISEYMQAELAQQGNNVFSKCKTVKSLAEYERNYACDRNAHRNERNRLFSVISDEPEKMTFVCNYMEYMASNKLTINFEKWLLDSPCCLLEELKKIQPVKECSHV